ncbi:hypothetical protein GCM10023178_00160 [Actinomadura luteofluorescens]
MAITSPGRDAESPVGVVVGRSNQVVPGLSGFDRAGVMPSGSERGRRPVAALKSTVPPLSNAIRSYEKVGCRPVGVMRPYERDIDGTWHDLLLTDLLSNELADPAQAASEVNALARRMWDWRPAQPRTCHKAIVNERPTRAPNAVLEPATARPGPLLLVGPIRRRPQRPSP